MSHPFRPPRACANATHGPGGMAAAAGAAALDDRMANALSQNARLAEARRTFADAPHTPDLYLRAACRTIERLSGSASERERARTMLNLIEGEDEDAGTI